MKKGFIAVVLVLAFAVIGFAATAGMLQTQMGATHHGAMLQTQMGGAHPSMEVND